MAGQPVIAANAPNPTNDLAMSMQGYSPQTVMAAQHSQYLAQALAAMREQGQNIRTPVALAGDLLANVLLQRKYGQSMQDFAQAAHADQGQIDNSLIGQMHALVGPQAGPIPPPSAATGPDVDGSGAAIPPPPPVPPTPQNTLPANATPPQVAQFSPAVLRTIYGEDTHNPDDQRAIAGVILRRAAMSGMTPDQVVATGGFEGANSKWARGATDDDLAKVAANVAGAQPGGFDAFYSPAAQAQLGRQPPGWENGKGVDVGGNRFFSGVYKPPAGMDPSRATTTGGEPSYSPPGQPGPLQTGSGPMPSPPSSPSPSASGVPAPGGPAGVPPVAASPAAGGTSAPASLPQGFTNHPYIDPRRAAYVEAEMGNPMTRMQGRADAHALIDKALGGDEWDTKYEPTTGQTIYTSKTRPNVSFAVDTQGARVNPVTSFQGDHLVSFAPGDPTHLTITQTGLPTERKAMMVSDGHGGYVNVPGPMTDSERGAYLGLRNDFYGSDPNKEYEKTANALNAVNDMLAHATRNNGVLDMGVLDNLIQAQTGLSAKQGNVQLLLSHLGAPQEFIGRISNLFGNGPITPEVLQQMRSVLRSYATQQAAGAQHRLSQQNAVSKAQGFGDLGITLLPLNPDARFSFQPAAPQPMPQRPGHSSAAEFQ